MVYNLIVTEKAEELLDQLIYHLVFRLKNDQAASHLFDSIEMIYDRLEENPYQFPESRDTNLKRLGYREAVVTGMNYVIVYRVEKHSVYVVGVFHQLEDYRKKV
ncbi:MAG: type II toxin-antitoxin system RelE/ParE family toxin [Lachnospiraceae bacterium]|nr:type II toxin-antitoxin system RelE/ParE family toxin [Lachnospiraceae bacterium]